MTEDKLSKKEYWDENLEKAKLPRVNSASEYHLKATMDFIDGPLSAAKKSTLLEIGCGSSGWLPYFRRRYGYAVSGLDYSEIGCRLAEENLRLLGLPCEGIICKDILEWDSAQQYGVIFSYGVIEHFNDPQKVIDICAGHLEEAGVLVTLVPNLLGLPGFLARTVVPEIYRMHKVITADELNALHARAGLEPVKTGYAGVFSLAPIPWALSGLAPFKEGTLRRRVCLGLINLANKLLSFFFSLLPAPASALFSPYLISIAKKPARRTN
jgi:2-polyprenyl-3-methyl-5-hydroxy-6-metoxy-1,4-benzoquinol methylase